MSSPPPVSHHIVVAHPDAASFCASIARRSQERAERNRQQCDMRDLYAEGFDPVLKLEEQPGRPGYAPSPEIIEESRRLQELDVLVFVYPVWFGTPPAMLKGYIERVVGSGISFVNGSAGRRPLENVRLVQISTSTASESWLAEKGVTISLHTVFDSYIAEVFGAKACHRLHLDGVVEGMGERQAAQHLAEVDRLADLVCAEANASRWQRARAEPPGAA